MPMRSFWKASKSDKELFRSFSCQQRHSFEHDERNMCISFHSVAKVDRSRYCQSRGCTCNVPEQQGFQSVTHEHHIVEIDRMHAGGICVVDFDLCHSEDVPRVQFQVIIEFAVRVFTQCPANFHEVHPRPISRILTWFILEIQRLQTAAIQSCSPPWHWPNFDFGDFGVNDAPTTRLSGIAVATEH